MKKMHCFVSGTAAVLRDRRSGRSRKLSDKEAGTAACGAAQACILHVTGQYSDPVPEDFINFFMDTACVMTRSDGNGTVTLGGAPDIYPVQLPRVPEGCSFDPAFELYTGRGYGRWPLRVMKD